MRSFAYVAGISNILLAITFPITSRGDWSRHKDERERN
jgi:hypothetical protein